MDLKEYIRRNYKTPNPFVLEGLGASDELIAYLRYTPENTNFNVTDPYCGGGTEPIGNVWYTGKGTYNEDAGLYAGVLTPTEIAETSALLANPSDYEVRVNGTLCGVHSETTRDPYKIYVWQNNEGNNWNHNLVIVDGGESVQISGAVPNATESEIPINVTVTKK